MSVRVEGGGGVAAPPPTNEVLSIIETYEAAIAESSHNFNFPAIDFDDDSELILKIDGVATADFALFLRFNANVTAYFVDGSDFVGGVATPVDSNNQTHITLIGSGQMGADSKFFAGASIQLSKGAASDFVSCLFSSGGDLTFRTALGQLRANTSSLTDVEVSTSASTWKIGTRITLYRMRRVAV